MAPRNVFCSTLAIATLATVPALAESFTYPIAHVRFLTPAGWFVKTSPNGLVTADRANDTAVAFTAVEDGAVGQASRLAERRLANMITGMKITKEERLTINGMPAVAIEGDGFKDNVNIDWALVVVGTPAPDHDLMAVAIAEDAKLFAHKDEIRGIFRSITPM